MATREKTADIRLKIIRSTDDLLYKKGYNLMSFTDIASAANIPRGNLNYHFKTKEDVLNAVIDYRLEQITQMLQKWNKTIPTPLERLKRYAQIPIIEINNVTHSGCPMGSLNTELGKVQINLRDISRQQFDLFITWLTQQFEQLVAKKEAPKLAMHLLVRTQGIATMAHVYEDKDLVKREVTEINNWLDSFKPQ